ncbi:MAG: hypothetical protein C0403_04380 [Desulfobacterium sp.]|nr:hypothetical protein [Desulfobacterium sp.]
MRKTAIAFLIIIVFVCNIMAYETKANKKNYPGAGVVEVTTNIHYSGRYCLECHENPPTDGHSNLRFEGSFKGLCRCHQDAPGEYPHPVEIPLSKEKKERIPAGFPLWKGKIDCITCHDIKKQCSPNEFKENTLRGAPYPRRTDFCYQCHDRQQYVMLDPHKQIDGNGSIDVNKCLYCHVEKPDVQHSTFKDVKLIGNLEVLCQRCHSISGNHSGNYNHMIKPSTKGLLRMKRMRKKYNIILPLNEDGQMTCITCHNPHEKGIIPEGRPGAKGADSHYRHRLPDKLCVECHEM